MLKKFMLSLLATSPVFACGHGSDDPIVEELEVITTVELTFTPAGGGTPVIAVFDDPDGDGGDPPTIDPVALAPGEYALAVRFENGLEEPPEDITIEVEDESDQHQVFFTGSAVDGPASDNPGAALQQRYADEDSQGLPLGLLNTATATVGSGDLIVTLRHLPPVASAPVKTADTATQVRDAGFAGIGGSSDAQVTFAVTVQ